MWNTELSIVIERFICKKKLKLKADKKWLHVTKTLSNIIKSTICSRLF